MRFSNKTRYALIALVDLAVRTLSRQGGRTKGSVGGDEGARDPGRAGLAPHPGQGAARRPSVQVRQLAERQGVPARFLEQIFQELRRAGLVTARRGPRGGFSLVPSADQVTVADVVRILEGPVRVGTEPGGAASGEGPVVEVVDEAFEQLGQRIERVLQETTLAQLAERALQREARRAPPKRYVYVI